MAVEDLRRETDANQAGASDPRVSAWVSANAGAGKTTVLVRRVLRLLLHTDPRTGAPARPESILCLTYTKAAAGEMKNRLFERLARWATCTDEELIVELTGCTGSAPDEAQMARARALFAGTLDTQGGLKVYTIHAFCERLLHRFPLEAGISTGFTVLDDYQRRDLLDDAIDEVLAKAADAKGPLGNALMAVAAAAGDDQFREIVNKVLEKREQLRAIVRAGEGTGPGEAERKAIALLLGAPERADEPGLVSEMAAVLDDALMQAAIAALDGGAKTDADLADALRSALEAKEPETRASALEPAFLTQAGEMRKRLFTKAIAEGYPDLADALTTAQDRYYRLACARCALDIAGASAALLTLADAIFEAYERRKRLRAALDYDDLIEKTGNLLRRGAAAAWVLYKLDYGIDHLLVDEAQDTSPAQWRVIAALTGEFFAGEGARKAGRTVFAVGDEKQSIYSFQGADPAAFAAQGRTFKKQAEAAGGRLKAVPLTVSFRSTSAVLDAVDRVFLTKEAATGLSFDGNAIVHQAVRTGEPGVIEIWPTIKPGETDPVHAFEPHRETATGREPVGVLAGRIADTIARWLDPDDPDILASKGRPVRPGDILVLLRRRDPFTRAMIRELKARNIPVAGADRMQLSEQLAVMDLLALTEFLLMSEDDLSLATVLKSPLFGFDDGDLFDLAWKRNGTLWSALQERASEKDKYVRAAERLERWLKQADTRPPYEFFATLLEENGMEIRHRLIARLGADAADALDEFLNLALLYERDAPVSLQGFLAFVSGGEAEVKRDMEQGRDEVRIMTVHGAKGLEAEIVFLPDTCALAAGGRGATVLPVPRASAPPGAPDHIVWVPPGSIPLDRIEAAKEDRKARELEEYHRLLYVAMTRARDRLYICGWETSRGKEKGCWYDLVFDGLKELVREAADANGETVWRYETAPDFEASGKEEEERRRITPEDLPSWALAPPPAEPPVALPVAPSALPVAGEDNEPSGMSEQNVRSPLELADESRFLRGTIIHTLLQHLPDLEPENRMAAAQRFVARRGKELDDAARDEIVAETFRILEEPEFAPLFGPESLAEVSLAALFERESDDPPVYEITGQIDRIAILDDVVLIVDYKTNRPPPKCAEDVAPGYLAQLAAYRAGIRAVFPQKRVQAALLWTDGPRLMLIPDAMLDTSEAQFRKDANP